MRSYQTRTYPRLGIHSGCHVLRVSLSSSSCSSVFHYQWTPEVRSSLHPQGVGVPSFIPLRTQNVVFALVAPHPHVCVFVLKSARSRRVGHLESLRNIFSRLRCLYIKIRPRICEGSNASKLCTADENVVEATIFQVKTTYLCLNGHTYLPFADR